MLGPVTSGWAWPLNPGASVPAVGSMVYVTFENGDPNFPVYFNNTGGGGTSGALLAANNLSDLANVSTARTNLGLGSAATSSSSAFDAAGAAASAQSASLQKSSNLSDVASASTARTNLGLGTAATLASTAVAQTANNLSDLASVSTARTNLGLGSAATLASTAVAQTANNLSDLASASTARTNLGLGSAATQATTAFAQVANNLSDVTASTARQNLSLAASESPTDYGLLGWSSPVSTLGSANAPGAGTLVLIMLRIAGGQVTFANVDYMINAAGATLTANQCLVGLYTVASGTATLIGKTGDQSTNFTVTGAHKAAVTVQSGQSLTVAAGTTVYVGFLAVGTTMPTFMRASTQNYAVNYGLSAGSYRACNYSSSLTALPTSVTLSSTTSSSGFWAGAS